MENINNPYAGKSRAELERQAEYIRLEMLALEKAEAKAKEAKDAKMMVICAALLPFIVKRLGDAGKLGKLHDVLTTIPPQAWPRPALMGKVADMSETEVHNIKEAAFKMLDDLAK